MKRLFTLICITFTIGVTAQNLQWVNAFGGTSTDNVNSIVLDDAGNIYSTGYFSGSIDFDSGPGTYILSGDNDTASIFILKNDPNGNLIWAKQIRAVTTWITYGPSIILDKGMNIYITGHFWNSVDFDPGPASFIMNGGYHVDFTMKLNSFGNFVWAKKINDGCGLAFCLASDNNGNVLTAGTFAGTNDFDPGPGTYTLDGGNYYDIYISKLDSSGNFLWAAKMGGTDMDAAYSIKTDKSGNVYATGYFKSVNADFDPGPATYSMAAPNSNEDVFIIKLDPQGNLVWVRQMTGPNNQTGFGLNIDKLGNLITTGLFQGISDFNPPSATYTMSPHNSLNNDYEIFIHKIDSAGQFIWAKQIGGSDFSRGTSVTVDSLNNILTTGYIVGTADFDPGPAVYNLTSAGGTDVFLSRLDPNGNFICASVFGGPGYDEAYSIQNTKTGNIYVAGIFKVVADFDPGPGVHNISSNGSDDLFIAKYNSCFLTVGEKEITHNPFFSLYPNPANGFITLLNGTNVPAKTEVTLFNSLGEKIFQSTILEKNSFTIDVKEYQRGIYFMEAKNSSERMVTKIILE